nr:hypothetical protein [Tanacetum cinerariifolium]
MATADAYEETERVKVNCTSEDTLQQASTSETQYENAPSMTQIDQLSVEQGGEIVEQHHANVEETRMLYDSLYNNLAIEVKKVTRSIES